MHELEYTAKDLGTHFVAVRVFVQTEGHKDKPVRPHVQRSPAQKRGYQSCTLCSGPKRVLQAAEHFDILVPLEIYRDNDLALCMLSHEVSNCFGSAGDRVDRIHMWHDFAF